MASINFKGKTAVWNHHLSVPYHTLEKDKKNSLEGKNDTENLIIEGDNLLALKALLPKYQGKVKCIYIDPPYNTGNEGWVYNDKVNNPVIKSWIGEVVGKDGDDLVRHDKWLAMMTPRLKLLKELLSQDGIIFVSLDENESHRLRQLMDEIFDSQNFIGELIWKNKHGGGGDSPFLVKEHEHIFVYASSLKDLPELFVTPTAEYEKMFRFEDSKGKYYLDRMDKKGIATDRPNLIYDIVCPDGSKKTAAPIPWRLSKAEFERRKKEDEIVFKKDKNDEWQIYTKTYLVDSEGNQRLVKARSVLKQEIVGFTQDGNKELEELFGVRLFNNPKPTKLLGYLLDYAVRDDKNCIVLDSFAGSASSAHAVLDMNKRDGGQRKFIQIQIPEQISKETPAYKAGYKWVHEITRDRVKKVIKRDKLDVGFTYYTLGPDIDGKKILTGKNMPTWDVMAKYVHFLATGKPIDEVTMAKKTCEITATKKGTGVYLIYADTLEELKKLAITRDWLEAVKDKAGKKIVYAPACFLDKEILDEYNISFVQVPFNLFTRK